MFITITVEECRENGLKFIARKKCRKRAMRENSADGFVIKEEAYLDFDGLLFTSFKLLLTVIKLHKYQTTIILCAGYPYNITL